MPEVPLMEPNGDEPEVTDEPPPPLDPDPRTPAEQAADEAVLHREELVHQLAEDFGMDEEQARETVKAAESPDAPYFGPHARYGRKMVNPANFITICGQPGCSWQGNSGEVIQHYRSAHPDVLMPAAEVKL